VTAPFVGFEQHFVGDDVQFLLHFALHVFALGTAQHTTQSAFVHGVADAFASARHHFKQQTQVGRDVAFVALLLDQITGEGNFAHGVSLIRFRRRGRVLFVKRRSGRG
jgi:hypothetical protein